MARLADKQRFFGVVMNFTQRRKGYAKAQWVLLFAPLRNLCAFA